MDASETLKVLNLETLGVTALTRRELAEGAHDGQPLTRALPPRINEQGNAQYHQDPNVQAAVAMAVRALARGHEELRTLAGVVSLAPDSAETTLDMLIEAAADAERSGDRRAREYLGLAGTLEDKLHGANEQHAECVMGHVWDAMSESTGLLASMSKARLSSGDTFGQGFQKAAYIQAERMVARANDLVQRPFSAVIGDLQSSMEAALVEKKRLLNLIIDASDRHDLQVEVIALDANLRCCAVLLREGADYDTYTTVTKRLTQEIQDTLADTPGNDTGSINIGEAELQALASLKDQLANACRIRMNATSYLFGGGPSEGLAREAVAQRRRALSSTYIDGLRAIDTHAVRPFAADLVAQLAARGIVIRSASDILTLCRGYSLKHVLLQSDVPEDQLLQRRVFRDRSQEPFLRERVDAEVKDVADLLALLAHEDKLNIDTVPFEQFVTRSYLTSCRGDLLDQQRARFWRYFSSVLDYHLGIEDSVKQGHEPGQYVQGLFERHITAVAQGINTEDFVAAAEQHTAERVRHDFALDLTMTLDQLNVPHGARTQYVNEHQREIGDVLLASYELRMYANDTHHNPSALISALVEARFLGKPLTPMIIRCLRWCYPYRQLEIAPHAGDYETKGPAGEPVKRNEWVEAEKLRIFYDAVVRVMRQHNIPLAGVTFVAAGDYDLEGPGYNFGPEDPPRRDALSYVASLPDYIQKWGVLPEGLPVRIVTLKELAAQVGQELFDAVLAFAEEKYDALFTDYNLRFLGLSARRLEQMIDQEHEHRVPFNEGWTRKTSRAFTRFRVTQELAYGAIIAQMSGPRTLTLSGNAAAGFTFAQGGAIIRMMQAAGRLPQTVRADDLPVTLMRSKNDGTQSKLWQAISEVVQ